MAIARSLRRGEHAAGQAVLTVVGDPDRRRRRRRSGITDEHRAEDLLLRDRHRVVHVGEQRRLDVEALSRWAGGRRRRASVAPSADAPVDEDCTRSRCFALISGPWKFAGIGGSPYGMLLRPRSRIATPSSYGTGAAGSGSGARSPARVHARGAPLGSTAARSASSQDDHGGLAAELEEDPLERGRALLHDPLPGRGGAGERDHVDPGSVISCSPAGGRRT